MSQTQVFLNEMNRSIQNIFLINQDAYAKRLSYRRELKEAENAIIATLPNKHASYNLQAMLLKYQ